MAEAQKEYFKTVTASDIHPYGYGAVKDFLGPGNEYEKVDWVITNPPFRLAEDFISKGLELADVGIAMLTRTVFLESIGRYNRMFSKNPPTIVAQFSERVPMVKGRLDKRASTATGYAWMIWEKGSSSDFPRLSWISPCRRHLERVEDYDERINSNVEI